MTSPIYIGLDIATTTGISIYSPENNRAKVHQYTGTPNQLWTFIHGEVLHRYQFYPVKNFVLEIPLHFRNAKTVRSLNQRYGYIRYSLQDYGHLASEMNLREVRGYFLAKNKEEMREYFKPMYRGKKAFTDNHSDALAVAIYKAVLHGYEFYPVTFQIEEMLVDETHRTSVKDGKSGKGHDTATGSE